MQMGYNRAMAWDISGHEWAVELLRSHIAGGHVRHAYLITGPDGVGKRTLALRFAQALQCQAAAKPGDVCGKCRACRQVPTQTYADLHVIEPDESGRSLRVEQVRDLQRFLSLSPIESRWRIALLLRFHEATPSAANALLKTLEEPPAPVVLVVTARSAEALLPTVVSRCEVVPLRPVPLSDVIEMLKARGESPDQAQLIAGLAAGSPGKALRLLQEPIRLEERGQMLEALHSVLRAGRAERFAYAETLAKKERSAAVQVLEVWQSLLRDVLLTSAGTTGGRGNPDQVDTVAGLALVGGTEAWAGAVAAIERTLRAIDANANVRLALEVLALDLPRLP